MKRTVVFSHGFGVRSDDRGLFPAIVDGLGLEDSVMFDYGIVDQAANTVTFPPLAYQAKQLQKVIAQLDLDDPSHQLTLICHSQGSIVAAMALPTAHQIIMLAPPTKIDPELTIAVFADRPGTVINRDGESRFARADGSTTIVEADYLQGLRDTDAAAAINRLAEQVPVTIIKATNDEVLDRFQLDGGELSPKIKQLELPADHNFTGPVRGQLIQLLARELA